MPILPMSCSNAAAFAAAGFIHCTTEPEVLLQIVNRFYKDVPGKILTLVIDEAKVEAEVKLEEPANPDGSTDISGEPVPRLWDEGHITCAESRLQSPVPNSPIPFIVLARYTVVKYCDNGAGAEITTDTFAYLRQIGP